MGLILLTSTPCSVSSTVIRHGKNNPTRGSIAIGDRIVQISELYYVTLTPELHTNGLKRYRQPSRMGAIWVKDRELIYLFDTRLINSLFVRLLLLNPLSPPPGFKPLKYILLHGGVWEVE